MKHFSKPAKWMSVLALIAVVMTSMVGASFLSPGKALACSAGLTPGFWKNHTELWTGFSPGDSLSTLYSGASLYGLGNVSLLDALSFPGGKGLDGAAKILLRAAVAAALNEVSPIVNSGDYSYPPEDLAHLVAWVNIALTQNRNYMLGVAAQLDAWNNLGVAGAD
jgi:hypothetical protein